MTIIIIDLFRKAEEEENERNKKEAIESKPEVKFNRRVQKQVINIDGEIVVVD